MTELKTLKDYFEIGKGQKTRIDKGSFAYSGICWKCKNKVGKKALDPYSALCFNCLKEVIQSDLRAEAIKWIKNKDEQNSTIDFEDWINFFNITEEDLK